MKSRSAHILALLYGVSFALTLGFARCSLAQYTNTIDFENYALGNVDGQFGWNGQNADATVTNVNPLFGTKSLFNDGSSINSWPYYSYGVGAFSSGCSLSVVMKVVTDTSSSDGNGFYISPVPGANVPIWISFVGGVIRSWSYDSTNFQHWVNVGTYTVGDVYRIDVNNIQYNSTTNPATMDLEITDLTTAQTVVSDPGAVASVVDFLPWATSDYAVVPASYGGGSALYDNITFISATNAGPPPPPPQATNSSTINFENFALGNVDGQFGWNGQNAIATITNVDPISGTKSLFNDESTGPSWPYYSYGMGTFSSGCGVSLQMQVVGDTSSSIGNGFYISPAPGANTPIWISFLGGNIRSYSYNSTNFQYWKTLGTYKVGDVYQIDVNNIQYRGTNNPATVNLEITDLTTSNTIIWYPGLVVSKVDFLGWATNNYAVVIAGYGLGGSARYDNITFTPPPPPSLSILPPSSPGQFVVQLTGQTNIAYVLQSSPNLHNWTPVATNVFTGSPLNFTNVVVPGTSQQFWRALLEP